MYNQSIHFHFTGIGGSGMSGLAEILLTMGFKVSGSDLSYTDICRRLEGLGAKVSQGHSAEHIPDAASLLVYSSAIKEDNPEIVEARRRKIPVIPRAEVLAELMRLKFAVGVAGAHGKTTTTSMTAHVLQEGGLDPTVVIGGQVRSIGSGGRVGSSSYLVAETDESDRSFLLLKPTIAIVTNLDNEHMNAYSSVQELDECFEKFVHSVPFYGLAILCIDCPRVRGIASRYSGRKVTYGLSPDAEISLSEVSADPGGTHGVVRVKWKDRNEQAELSLPMYGRHLLVNSLASIAVGLEFGLSLSQIVANLKTFPGVKRRLEVLGAPRGITIINDYGHHPTEIKASIQALKDAFSRSMRKLHVIFQPHRYSRTRDCFVDFLNAFDLADNVVITEIYAASEDPIEGVSGEALCKAIEHPSIHYVKELKDIFPGMLKDLAPGDLLLCLGAGSIGAYASTQLVRILEGEVDGD